MAAVELGKAVTRDESRLRAAYDLTLREIALRLKGESEQRKNDGDGKQSCGDGIGDDVPPVAGPGTARPVVADGAAGKEPEKAVVIVHGDNDTISGAGGQADAGARWQE